MNPQLAHANALREELTPPAGQLVSIWTGKQIAQRVVKLGLGDWVATRLSIVPFGLVESPRPIRTVLGWGEAYPLRDNASVVSQLTADMS